MQSPPQTLPTLKVMIVQGLGCGRGQAHRHPLGAPIAYCRRWGSLICKNRGSITEEIHPMSTATNGHRSVFRSHLDRLRASLLLMGFLLLALPRARPASSAPLVNQGCRTRATVNGPLLVLYARGGPGHLGPTVGDGRILVVHGSKVVRTLTHGLPFPITGGLVSSPCGRYVPYGADAMPGPGRPPQTQRLWLTTSDGRATRRLLLPPPSATGQPDYSIGPIAWSPDRLALAYAVNNAQDYGVNPR